MAEKIGIAAVLIAVMAATGWLYSAQQDCARAGGVFVKQAIGFPVCLKGK